MNLGASLLKTAAKGGIQSEFSPAAVERSRSAVAANLLQSQAQPAPAPDAFPSGWQGLPEPDSRPAYLDARPGVAASTLPKADQSLAAQTRGGKTPGSFGLFQFNRKAHPEIDVKSLDIEGQFREFGRLSGGGKDFSPWRTTRARLDAPGPVRMRLTKELGGKTQDFAPIKSLSARELQRVIEKKHGPGSYQQWSGLAKQHAPHADPNRVLNFAGAESSFDPGAAGDWGS
jgi:hypothetical protein